MGLLTELGSVSFDISQVFVCLFYLPFFRELQNKFLNFYCHSSDNLNWKYKIPFVVRGDIFTAFFNNMRTLAFNAQSKNAL